MSAKDTQEATGTGLSDATDTSNNEDSLDTDDLDDDAEQSLLEEDEALEVEDESDDTEEGDEDDSDDEATDSDEDDEQESDDDVESDKDTKDEDIQEEDTTSDSDETDADAERKRQNAEAAQQRIADREAKRREAKAQAQQTYIEKGAQDIYDRAIDNGLTPQEAQIEANRELAVRQLQVDAYNNRIETNTSKVQTGIDKAVAAIPLFRTGSAVVKEQLAASLDEFEAKHVRRDGNGDIMDVTGDVFDFLQKKADSIKALQADGAQLQVSAKKKQKTRTFTPPSRKPKKPKADPDIEGFDDEANKY